MSSAEIAQIVAEVYHNHLAIPPEWANRAQAFLDGETERLSRQIAEVAAQLGAQAVREWTAMAGRRPDILTQAGLLSSARMSAMEIVLTAELYELIPQPPENLVPTANSPDRASMSWRQRWTIPEFRSEPDGQTEQLIEALWPESEFSPVFQIKAGYLLAARAEDGLALPRDRQDPMTGELAQMIRDDLRRDGLPDR